MRFVSGPSGNPQRRREGEAAMAERVSQDQINAILWKACDTFRGTVDPSEYKNYILVMLFLKYITDVWFDHREALREKYGDDEERIERSMGRERFVLPPNSDFYTLYDHRNASNIG